MRPIHSYISCRVSSSCCLQRGVDSMQGQPIINERVPIYAKFKSSTLSTPCTCSLSVPLPTRLIYFGMSTDGSGPAWGYARASGWSSHTGRRRAVREYCQIRKSRPTKSRRNFLLPSSSSSTIFCSQRSSLLPIVGQSQSELQGQSSTGQIDLPFCCAVSIAIEPFHFLLIAYHAQRRALSP